MDKGSDCKSEDLTTYEEALDQTTDCGGSETLGSRVPSLECTASEPYSSPHKLGSGAPRALPGPVLVLSAYLNYSQVRRLRYLIIFLVFHYYFYAFPLIKILACLIVAFADFSRINLLLLNRFKPEAKIIFHLIKHFNLIFNYFKFNINKWQYYFILISVNLWFNLIDKNPEPLTTPSCLIINGFDIGKGEKTRRARRYNYFYFYYNCNYYYYKHYYTILRRIAQNSNEIVLNSRKPLDLTRIPLNLVIIINLIEKKSRDEIIYARINNKENENSLTINRIKFYSDIVITIILFMGDSFRIEAEIAEALILNVNLPSRKTKSNKENAASVSFLIAAVVENATINMGRQENNSCPPEIHFFIRGIRDSRIGKSEQKINFIPVNLCCLPRSQCSDPNCEFQTFLKLS